MSNKTIPYSVDMSLQAILETFQTDPRRRTYHPGWDNTDELVSKVQEWVDGFEIDYDVEVISVKDNIMFESVNKLQDGRGLNG